MGYYNQGEEEAAEDCALEDFKLDAEALDDDWLERELSPSSIIGAPPQPVKSADNTADTQAVCVAFTGCFRVFFWAFLLWVFDIKSPYRLWVSRIFIRFIF